MVACTDANTMVNGESPVRILWGSYSQVGNEPKRTIGKNPSWQVGPHWLRGSVPMEYREQVVHLLCLYFGKDFEKKSYGRWMYDRSYEWAFGVSLFYHSDEGKANNTKDKITIDIPGSALDSLTIWVITLLIEELNKLKFGVSRMDIYFDDYERIVTPAQIARDVYRIDPDTREVLRADFSGYRRADRITAMNKGKVCKDMITFGRRGNSGSGRYFRIYDKELESDGENKAVRYELELSGDRAKAAFATLVACGKDEIAVAKCMGNFIGGSIDFLKRHEKPQEKNLERFDRWQWWDTILEKIGQAKLRVYREPKTMAKAVEYIDRQTTATLQMIKRTYGPEMFTNWLESLVDGPSRLKREHLRAIADHQAAKHGGLEYDLVSVRASMVRFEQKLLSEKGVCC